MGRNIAPPELLVAMPPLPISDRVSAGNNADLIGCILCNFRMCSAAGSLPGSAVYNTVHVRKQNQQIGHHQLADSGRQSIVIAIANFFGRDGIVLIDDRYN